MNGYRAQQLPDGQVIVLAPDGLTWEADPGKHPTLEAAQSHALALNEWLARKPDPTQVSPFFLPVLPVGEPTEAELIAAVDRIFAAEDHFDLLSRGLSVRAAIEMSRGVNHNPQEVRNG